jgi:phospholipid/cholesterol/gamma-HCH transport system substrate-binding protein
MSDYDYLQQRRNMIVGAFVIVGICIFAYMVFLFGELPVVTAKFTSYSVQVNFPYAPGVEKSTPVKYCGYDVGRVTSVSPPVPSKDEQGRFIHQVAVDLAISKNYANIPSNVDVELIRRGLGSSYIELVSKPMEPNEFNALEPKFLSAGMTLQGKGGSSSELLPKEIQDKIEILFTKITTLVDNVNTIVGDEQNKINLKNTLANLSKATEESIATLQQIKEFSQTGQEKLTSISDSVMTTSEGLGETLIEVRRLLHKINSGQGTVGKLINDDQLYENLLDSSEELKAALEKMKKVMDKTSEKGIQLKVF